MPGPGARHGERPSTLREIAVGAYHPQNLAHIEECQQQLEGYQLAREFAGRLALACGRASGVDVSISTRSWASRPACLAETLHPSSFRGNNDAATFHHVVDPFLVADQLDVGARRSFARRQAAAGYGRSRDTTA